jgi:hypothetical protein
MNLSKIGLWTWAALAWGAGSAAGQLSPASSGPIEEIKTGALVHDMPGFISGHQREHGVDLNLELIFSPSVNLLSGTLRPALGGTANFEGYTSQVYAYGRWERDFASGFFTATGVGGSWNNGELRLISYSHKALGSHLLFHLPFEFGWWISPRASLSLYYDHMSNAYLAHDNEGLDTLGVRYGIRL